MLRILIVDDEKIERNGIRFLLKKVETNCYIKEAKNGKEAFEYIKNNEIDILLTDVKMPFMDGLELIAEVSRIRNDIKIVIFSGYSEFEYARNAMKLGVSDYILKPVDPKEFGKTMKRIILEINEKKIEEEKKVKGLSFYREHLLYSLVNGTSIQEILKKAEGMVDTAFLENYIKMFLIEFNKEFFGKIDDGFVELLKKRVDIHITYLNLNPQQSLIFFTKKSRYTWRELAENITSFVKKIFNVECYVAISDDINSANEISERMEELELLMEEKFYKTQKRIFYQDENQTIIKGEHIQDDVLMKKMKQDIKVKDIENLKEHFEEFCLKYKNKTDYSQVYIKFIFSNLLKSFFDIISDMTEKELNKEIDILYRATDYQNVTDIMYKNIDRLENSLSKETQSVRREIETVKQYIFGHYNEEIGVDQLANMVYMAPSYLSYIFKKETGQNLCKYIKSYRMEKAREMLMDSNIKIVNIARMVGYVNTSYFCQSFREYFGISPQKFRNSAEDDEGEEL